MRVLLFNIAFGMEMEKKVPEKEHDPVIEAFYNDPKTINKETFKEIINGKDLRDKAFYLGYALKGEVNLEIGQECKNWKKIDILTLFGITKNQIKKNIENSNVKEIDNAQAKKKLTRLYALIRFLIDNKEIIKNENDTTLIQNITQKKNFFPGLGFLIAPQLKYAVDSKNVQVMVLCDSIDMDFDKDLIFSAFVDLAIEKMETILSTIKY